MISSKVLKKEIPIFLAASFLLFFVLISGVIIILKYNPANRADVKGLSTNNTNILASDVLPTPVSSPALANVPITPEIQPEPTTQPTANTLVVNQPEASIPAPAPTPAPVPAPVPQSCDSTFNDQFLTLLNNYRVSKGKSTLSMNTNLNSAACGHSTWMNNTGTFSHTGANGSSPWDRCNATGTSCDGENLGWSTVPSPENILDQWQKSPEHDADMLNDHTIVGLGLSGIYVTADFK